jgi:hypothetical protein
MAYTPVYTAANRTAVAAAIVALATRASARVTIDGRSVDYMRSDLPFLRQILADMEIDIAKGDASGGMCLITPGGRT